MESGYLSREAVKDLLAVRDGELDYLRKQVHTLETSIELLRKQNAALLSMLEEE